MLLNSTRSQLLSDLEFLVEDAEFNADILLKGFDLSLHDCDIPSPVPDTEFSQKSFTDLPPSHSQIDTASLALRESEDSRSDHVLEKISQNPFLSTPLRLKHFSKLSPTILRDLLRSPSLRSSFCDDSLDDSDRVLPEQVDLQSRLAEESLPLTPPPSGRIKPLPQLPDPSSDHVIGLPTAAATQHQGSLVSAATVRDFQRVIDEMKGVGVADLGYQWNPLQEDQSMESFPLSSPMSLSSPAVFFLPEHDRSIPEAQDVIVPSWMNRSLGALEQEFVGLLQQQAAVEEGDAKQLRLLADRLERTGKGRRNLASLITERKVE